MPLRDYQLTCVDATIEQLRQVQSTLIVLATGGGKTKCAAELIRRARKGRTMFLVNRQQLAVQAVKSIEAHTGLEVEVEMGDMWATESSWGQAPVVVSSVQTQNAGKTQRMRRFDPDAFSLVVVDEAHNFLAPSHRKVLEYYKRNSNAKFVGLTATPDRGDRQALGQIFDSVSFDFGILDCIDAGWLVPIHQQMVTVEDLDFSHIKTTAGDLNSGELAMVLESEKNLHGIVSSTIGIVGNRKTILFAVSVKQAERYAEIFNRHRPGMAAWVCGETPKDERFNIFQRFAGDETQVLVNVGVTVEGYDNPRVEVVAMAAPTKVRSKYAQKVGRGTRALEGIVDGPETPELRKAAIAQSAKPSCLILDFVGNSGKHKLITTADILGGKVSPESAAAVLKLAKQTGQPVDIRQALADEEEERKLQAEERKLEAAAKRARLTANAKYSLTTVDPFDALHITPNRQLAKQTGILSDKQTSMLLRAGVDPTGMSYGQAKQIMTELWSRWKDPNPSDKQLGVLRKFGYPTEGVTKAEAKKLIDRLAANNWSRPSGE